MHSHWVGGGALGGGGDWVCAGRAHHPQGCCTVPGTCSVRSGLLAISDRCGAVQHARPFFPLTLCVLLLLDMWLQSLLISTSDGLAIPIQLTPDATLGYTVQATPTRVEKTAKLPCWGTKTNTGGAGGCSASVLSDIFGPLGSKGLSQCENPA